MTPGGFEDVQPELTGLIFGGLFPAILIAWAGVLVTTALMAFLFRDAIIWSLMALGALAGAARVGIAEAYRRRALDEVLPVEDAQRWEKLFGIASIAFSALFGLVTLRVFSLRDAAGEMLCSLICVVLCAGLAQRHGMRPLLMKISGLTLLGAVLLSAAIFGPLLVKLAGVVVALYGLTFIQAVDKNFDAAVEQFRTKRTMLMNSQLDPLTSLPNRKFMRSRLTELCKSGASFAALFLDLDDFKIVNDTMGHGAGDDLLLQVTARLKAMMRETDLLARVGGDEFAVLQVPAKSKREVTALADRINQQIAAPYQIHGQKAVIGVSVGVRLALGGMHEPDDVLHRADTALYNVKAGGKGGYSVALD